jgi:hypothetical protein
MAGYGGDNKFLQHFQRSRSIRCQRRYQKHPTKNPAPRDAGFPIWVVGYRNGEPCINAQIYVPPLIPDEDAGQGVPIDLANGRDRNSRKLRDQFNIGSAGQIPRNRSVA